MAIVLSPILAFFTVEAFAVCAYHTWLEVGHSMGLLLGCTSLLADRSTASAQGTHWAAVLQQKGAPSFYEHADVGYWQVFSLTSFALSLLMVFRTNSSYARWWEARTVRTPHGSVLLDNGFGSQVLASCFAHQAPIWASFTP